VGDTVRVLLPGSSEVTYTDCGPEDNVTGLFAAALRERSPDPFLPGSACLPVYGFGC
jgi:hypothetical protein